MSDISKLTSEELSFRLDPKAMDLKGSSKNDWGIIGQERAVEALMMGIKIRSRGYNIFVSGDSGTGRSTAIKKILSQNNEKPKDLSDIAFVHNFSSPLNPQAIYLEPGRGNHLKKELHSFVQGLKSVIRLRLESEIYKTRKERIISQEEKEENKQFSEFEEKLGKAGFRIVQVSDGDSQAADIAPVLQDEVIDFDGLQDMVKDGTLSQEEWDSTREKYYHFIDEMKLIFQKLREKQEEMEEALENLRKETVAESIRTELDKLRKDFTSASVTEYFDRLETDIQENLDLFTEDEEDLEEYDEYPLHIRYSINVVVDNGECCKAPVVIENHPSYSNLFGTVETRFEKSGENTTNFTLIRAGSLLKANGGFLIIRVEDLLQEENVWSSLMRCLQTNTVEIQPRAGLLQLSSLTLKAEPVKIDVKIILIGNDQLYGILYRQDKDFQKFFKVTAEFDSVMKLDEHSRAEYITFINSVIEKEGLRPLTPEGYATIIEQAVRMAHRKDLISTRFSRIADTLIEAEYHAEIQKKEAIDRTVILHSLEKRAFLFGLTEEKIDDEILSGRLLFQVEGSEIGVVNGLAVYERGAYAFGRPVRITAQVSPGTEGLINIERESGLSGEIYDKAVLIIEGFLRREFASDQPLCLHASLCFEQSYSGVDGDSATSTEIFALLSALAKVPLRQDLAVTGSVNQLGEIQPVGGIIEKIEGFYDICKKKGLTGTQGVIIPASNRENLILKQEVLDAVDQNLFSIYPVTSVGEGIELLTGIPYSAADKKSKKSEISIKSAVKMRLCAYNEVMKKERI